jgi:four helix bundle protein
MHPVEFDFEKLDVYQKAVNFAEGLYAVTGKFPSHELFGVVSQLRRAALSISLNIAEGAGRYHSTERRQFYRVARSSVNECVALLEISRRQRYLSEERFSQYYQDCHELARMISGLIKSLPTPD